MTKQTKALAVTEQQDYNARFKAEQARLRRHYCNIFKFWRACALRRCRRARTCGGDAELCLKRRANEVPREAQWQARADLMAATRADAGPAERTAREFLPAALAAAGGA